MTSNPALDQQFSNKLSRFLNGLPSDVKRSGSKSTHAIKTFMLSNGVSQGSEGWANQIKQALNNIVDVEFLWDITGRTRNPDNPMEYNDLTFVAESENKPQLKPILDDAAKLPIARTDVRLMFFRANDAEQLEMFFSELARFFKSHRRTEVGDIYILAGMNNANGRYSVRKLTIRRDRSNVPEWEVVP